MGSNTQGALEVPAGPANGMLELFLRNLRAARFERVQIVALKPRFLDVLLDPAFDVRGLRELLRDGAVGGEQNEGS